jgi:hypothetical protein
MGKKSYCKGSQIAIAIYFIKFDYILCFKKLPLRILLLLLTVMSMHFVTAQQNVQGGVLNDLSGEKLNFQLYPNPYAGGKLHIVSPPTDIKNIMILNILGEVVFQTTTYENYVMPNNLNSGIYIVKIKQGGQQGLSRLVVP